jgi:thiamine pyrophosphate-dependent acetolactate synthase large subunit-like protein
MVAISREVGTGGAETVECNGAAALLRLLAAAGVRDLFGVPAGKLSAVLEAVGAQDTVTHLGVRHEASAAWMATAIYHATGRLAACYGESGPGSHNLIGGLGSAYANGLATIAITSSPPAHLSRPLRGMVMDTDNDRLFAGVTKWRARVSDAQRLPELVHEALRQALSGRPGPVALELTAEALDATCAYLASELDAPIEHVLPSGRAAADPHAVARAAELLLDARRPLLIAGGGVTLSDAAPALRALADELGAAATATQMGLGAVSTEDPAFFGHGGVIGGEAVCRAMAEADVVLAVGCRFSSWLWEGSAPIVRGWPEQELIQIDIDPLAIGRARPVSVGLCGDAAAVLEQLSAPLDGRRGAAEEEWPAGLVAQWREHRQAMLEGAGGEPLHPAALAEEIGRALPADSLVIYDGGHTTFWSNDFTPASEPRTRFHEPGMAHLGFGLPYALALKREFPERCVVNITGDGAFGFTLGELDTARRYGIAAITVIHNNEAWGVIRLGQSRRGFELGTSLEGTDYVAIAQAFGAHAERVEERKQVAGALERALASGRPAVIDARVRFETHPQMPRFAGAGRRAP